MYGSSLRIETRSPRDLRIRPTLAAVMPLPREEVTPPVTKTYFAMGGTSGGFSDAIGKSQGRQVRAAADDSDATSPRVAVHAGRPGLPLWCPGLRAAGPARANSPPCRRLLRRAVVCCDDSRPREWRVPLRLPAESLRQHRTAVATSRRQPGTTPSLPVVASGRPAGPGGSQRPSPQN